MSKINDLLVSEAEKYIDELLTGQLPDHITFHHLDYTKMLRKNAEIIGQQGSFSVEEMNMLMLSALFRNTGYVVSYENHLEESIKLLVGFLSKNGVDQQSIDYLSEIIRSTKIPHRPADKIAEALCDAELAYISMENGIELVDLLFEETANNNPALLNKRSAFEKSLIEYLSSHTFFTEYGRTVLQPGKEATVKSLSERLKWRKMTEGKKEVNDKNNIFYSRGVETMFRITARNQINLNSIADNKSNILISVNAIIISIIITMLAGNIGNMSNDIIPILIFLIICLATIIIAILSTRPNIVTRKFTQEDLMKKNVDLIFFGNFCKMDFDEYLKSIKEMMQDDDHLYATLIQNQYTLGKILSKKFRLVRVAYNVFMVGIIITVVAFLINYLLIRGAV